MVELARVVPPAVLIALIRAALASITAPSRYVTPPTVTAFVITIRLNSKPPLAGQ